MQEHADLLFAKVETDGCRLTVFAPSPECHEGWYNFDVRIEAPGITARLLIHEYGSISIAQFFSNLAKDWTVWTGAREWNSIEGNLHLSATIDRLGHVACVVFLRTNQGRGDWSATYTVMVDSGEQLSKFARDISAIFD